MSSMMITVLPLKGSSEAIREASMPFAARLTDQEAKRPSEYLAAPATGNVISTGQSPSVPVIILCSDMLEEILTSLGANPAEYTYQTGNEGYTIACCAFSIDPSHLPETGTKKVYSLPSPNLELSKEEAALKSLQHLDSTFQIQINDYNYQSKEDLLDKNRTLVNTKNSLLSAAVDIYNTMWREFLLELASAQELASSIMTTLHDPAMRDNIPSVTEPVKHSIASILKQLITTHTAIAQMVEDHNIFQSIISRLYSYII